MMKHKTRVALKHLLRLLNYSCVAFGVVVVVVTVHLGKCSMSRTVKQSTKLFLFDELDLDNSHNIWIPIRKVTEFLHNLPGNVQRMGEYRLWTSRDEYSVPCVCWASSNVLPPPQTDCGSVAFLEATAHPCAPYHPAAEGWVKREMTGLLYFTGKRKTYKHNGFYLDFNVKEGLIDELIDYEAHDWIDYNTDALVLEAVLHDSLTSCIIYLQLGLERGASHAWISTLNVWVDCKICYKYNNTMKYFMIAAMLLHCLTIVIRVPWSTLTTQSFRHAKPMYFWPRNTLILDLVIVVFYILVIVTQFKLQSRMKAIWRITPDIDNPFHTSISMAMTSLADDHVLALVFLVILQGGKVCSMTLSNMGNAFSRLARLLAVLLVVSGPFGVALHQFGVRVNNLSTVEDSMMGVVAAFLGEIDVTSLLATTHISGLIMFLVLFTVFTLILFPFVLEALSDDQPVTATQEDDRQKQRSDFNDRLTALINQHTRNGSKLSDERK